MNQQTTQQCGGQSRSGAECSQTCHLPTGLLAVIVDQSPWPIEVCRGPEVVYRNMQAQGLSGREDTAPSSGNPGDQRSADNLSTGCTALVLEKPTATPCAVAHLMPAEAVETFFWYDDATADEWTVAIHKPLDPEPGEHRLFADKIARLKAIVHEIRNTLTSAREALCILHEESLGPLGQQQRRFLHSAMEDLDVLVRGTMDLTSLWVTQAGVSRMTVRPVDVRRIVEQTMLCIRPVAQRRGISVEVDVQGPFPPLNGDHELLVQALRNVLTNAVRHTPDQGRIHVRAYSVEEALAADVVDDGPVGPASANRLAVIEVEDSGAGINEAEREKIFQPFERGGMVDPRLTGSGEGGMGLGLTIARDIVATHGGTLQVEGADGGGARFVFRFPSTESGLQSWMVRATKRAIEEVRPLNAPLAVMLLRFQADTSDTTDGDHAHLVATVQQLAVRNLRPTDTVLTVDGQLLLLINGCTRSAAFALIDRMLETLSKMSSAGPSAFERVGMAFGVAAHPQDGECPEDLLARAEAALDAFPIAQKPLNGR